MKAVLEFKDVDFSYLNAGKQINILKKANLDFHKGNFYTIIGPSGSGKTTLLALAAALDTPASGIIAFNGEDIKKTGLTKHRKNNVALIFQNYNLINYMTALENVIVAMDISGSYKENRKDKAMEFLLKLGLTGDEAVRNVMKLSGGQQQRVAIARALATDAQVILADEPTGNLDAETASEIVEVFKRLAHEYDKCVIVVSHSHDVAEQSDISYSFKKGMLEKIAVL